MKIIISFLCLLLAVSRPLYMQAQSDGLPRGASNMPYTRYEGENGSYGGGAALQTSAQFVQSDIASEASNQKYVSLPSNGSFVQWRISTAARGVNLRFTMPDNSNGAGLTGSLNLYVNGALVKTIDLTSYWAYQYFDVGGEGDPYQTPHTKTFMRFDEVHFTVTNVMNAGDTVKIQKVNGDGITYGVDFLELEPVPAAITLPTGYLSVTDYGAVANDAGDDYAAFNACIAAAASQGKNVYIPAGRFLLSDKLLLNVTNMKITGAGIWYTQVYFSTDKQFYGGIMARSTGVEIANFTLGTANNDRLKYDEANPRDGQKYKIYKGFMGTYGNGSAIHDIWVEHFECGFWIGGYDAPYPVAVTRNLTIANCRIRNNYADGVNFCVGTSTSTVTQCSLRNNGDDALAMWPASDVQGSVQERNNTFSNNTIENNWRAGSIAIFGGTGHQVHHNYIKDGVVGSGIRFTNDFGGFGFEYPGDVTHFYENTIENCGTSYDLWNEKRGAIEIFAGTGIFNMQFDYTTILNSQRDAIRISGNNLHDIVFTNTTIAGTGKDPITRDIPADVYGGFGIYCDANSQSMTFNNLSVTDAESGTYINRNAAFQLILQNVNIPVTSVSISPAGDTTLALNQTLQLTPVITPNDATNKTVSWASSNTSIITVDATGKITPVATGIATITVTTANGNKTATKKITVTPVVNPPCTAPVIAKVNGAAPVIDATIDAAWAFAPVAGINQVVLGARPADYAGKWRAMYDNNYLYLLVEVSDATRVNDSGANWWEDDVVEVFIDGNNSKGASYDGVNDFQFGFRWNDNTIHTGSNSVTNTTGINFKEYATAVGYNAEIAIPWSTIGATPAIGKAIGIDVQVDDDDNGGTRDAQVTSFATNTTAFQNPAVFGTVYMTTCSDSTTPPPVNNSTIVHASPVSGAIIIDGTLNETAWKINTPITKSAIGTVNNTASFGVLWDNNKLYIGARIFDSSLYNDSPDSWNNDALEVFIDANNNKSVTYDGYDNQFIKGFNSSALFSKTAISGAQHAWAAISGGYTVEISIPWSQLGITPGAGMQIGFDVANDDDDNGGDRDAQSVWQGNSNNYQNTSAFGTLVLDNSAATLVNALIEASRRVIADEAAGIQVTPNPVNNGYAQVLVSGIAETGTVKVFDMAGHMVYATTGRQRIPLHLQGLPKGMYLVQFITGNRLMNKKLLIK